MSGDSFDVVDLDAESLDEEFFIFAATGSEDFDCSAFSNQIEAMREKTEIYHFKDEPNESGNLMFHIVPGNTHNYEASYEYIYNGLPLFFKE